MTVMFDKGQFFQHKDGGVYRFVEVIRYSDRPNEQGVLYNHVWPFEESLWVRPIAEWTEDRFKPISASDATIFIQSMSRDEAQEFVKANKAKRK